MLPKSMLSLIQKQAEKTAKWEKIYEQALKLKILRRTVSVQCKQCD